MMGSNNRNSLICRNWKLPLCLAAISYLVVQLSMIHDHLFATRPVCRSSDFSSWVLYVNYFEVIAFVVILAIQCSQLALKLIPLNEFGSYASTLSVSSLAGISSMINLCTSWTGNCEDVFGVIFSGVLWAEWIACVPLLHYIVLATDTKLNLTQCDIIIIVLITMVFLFGMCSQLTHSFSLSIFLLTAAVSCYTIGSILFYFVTISNQEYFPRTQCESIPKNEFELHLKKTQTKLAICLLSLSPIFPFVYFLSLVRVMNHDATFTFITILNVLTKLIFSTLMSNSHNSVANEVIRQTLVSDLLTLTAETAANESRRLYVRYIMQEVRVPLSSISMGLGYLEKCSNIEDEAKEALLMMQGATGFMTQTINDVLSMQIIEEGKLELDFCAFSITNTINRVEAALHGLIKGKKINFLIRIHSEVPDMVIGDEVCLEHVLVNLVSNALKFTPAHSEVIIEIIVASTYTLHSKKEASNDIQIAYRNYKGLIPLIRSKCNSNSHLIGSPSTFQNSVSSAHLFNRKNNVPSNTSTPNMTATTSATSPATSTIIFSVIDNGPGICESDMKTLFLPFSQIRPHELQGEGGSGIGLVICKQIVELHGGSISCQSTLGVGSTFTFSIPFGVVVTGVQSNEIEDRGDDNIRRVAEAKVSEMCINSGEEMDYRPVCKVDNLVTSNNLTTNPPTLAIQQQVLSYHSNFRTKKRREGFVTSSKNMNMNKTFSLLRQNSGDTIFNTCDNDDYDDDNIFAKSNHFINSRFEKKVDFSESGKKHLKKESYNNENDHKSIGVDQPSLSLHEINNLSSSIVSNNNSNSNSNESMLILEGEKNTLFANNNLISSTLTDSVMTRTAAAAVMTSTKTTIINHVLLVGDMSSNRSVLPMLLKQKGITNSIAINGQEAFSLVMEGKQSFDLIFMDNSMPIMNGVEAVIRLRSFGYTNLIIIVTGNDLEEQITEFVTAGAVAIILTPISVLQINQILEHAKNYGNTHLPNHKIVFHDTLSYTV